MINDVENKSRILIDPLLRVHRYMSEVNIVSSVPNDKSFPVLDSVTAESSPGFGLSLAMAACKVLRQHSTGYCRNNQPLKGLL